MFKGEYQGGPFVDVFGAQGRDALSKKCKVTGTSTNIHKQYDKDVKSYVYVLEGEPTTSKIQFPKEDKQGLFLTQKFLVFQLFLPVGRPFSFEVAVTDHAQNKRRIFFSSNLKEISVTPLHARFPLTVLSLGSWLNLCLDLDSLVSETFNGPKFRAVESLTVTANCRLKKVFTLRAPPVDTSEDENHDVFYANSEPLPKNLQLMTTSDVSTITQILTYGKLCGKPNENVNSPLSTPSGHEGSTPRHDQETHIAFGTKVVKPPRLRRNSLKENRENASSKIPSNSRLSSSKAKHGQYDTDFLKSPLSPKGNQDIASDSAPTGIDANQATIQPRPPRTSSAGKTRRPIRLKSSSAGKARTNGRTEVVNDKPSEADKSATSSMQKSLEGSNRARTENLVTPSSKSIDKLIVNHGIDNRVKTLDINDDKSDQSCMSGKQELTVKQTLKGDLENHQISNSLNSNQSYISENINTNADALTLSKTLHDGDMRSSKNITNSVERTTTSSEGLGSFTNVHSRQILDTTVNSAQPENKTDKFNQMQKKSSSNHDLSHVSKTLELSNSKRDSTNASVNKSTNRQSSDNVTMEQKDKSIDLNNNEPLIDKDIHQPRTKPRMMLPLASNNPVFTFSSMPRSPRSGKKKLLDSPMVDNVITPSFEAAPEVMVSLAEDVVLKDPPARNGGQSQSNRGASLEDDFCKLSDDDYDEDGDGIQKLLQSSLSPRHSPMPYHHQLRQSIRSSMLKEIPSPIKENGYDAQNYQSENHLDTLNQSTASSWRFDTSDSSQSFNQSQQDLEDSLNGIKFPKQARHIAAVADVPVVDDNDEDGHSDCSDDTTYSTWRAPPQDLRGNKYQNEMKPPGQEPDLTATICMMDPRDYCDVFSPPIILGTPNKESNGAVPILSPLKSPHNSKFPGVNHQEEEELDLLYDPCLNCYFDPKTHKYYELS